MAKHLFSPRISLTSILLPLCLSLLFIVQHGISQICPVGVNFVYLNTQAEVNTFVNDYSGTCDKLSATLYIGPSTVNTSDITDISGLNFITHYGANLYIRNNQNLTTLTGVENIIKIGGANTGGLYIQNNDALFTLNYFTSLDTVAKPTLIDGNDNLLSIGNIGSSHKYFYIRDNPRLKNLNGLSGITSLIGLEIINNDSLSNLTGLEGLKTIINGSSQDYVSIKDNDRLISLFGLHNLTTYSGYNSFTIENNVSLTELKLDSLSSLIFPYVDTKLSIASNPSLVSIDMPNLKTIGSNTTGSFEIKNNDALTNLVGLEKLASVSGYLYIKENDALINLEGLDSLVSVGNSFYLENNSILSSMDGLNSLKSIIGSFVINANNSLADLVGLEGLKNVNSNFNITNNGALQRLKGLEGLRRVGIFNVTNNASLSNCCIMKLFKDGTYYYQSSSMNLNNNLPNCNSTTELYYCNEDGIPDNMDNCPDMLNPHQLDQDNDGIGDACDNCPTISNADQLDANDNGIGDVCETESGEGTGKVGLGTGIPKSKLQVENGDIYIENIHRGIIVRSKGGKCFRLQPNEIGQLTSTEIECPN